VLDRIPMYKYQLFLPPIPVWCTSHSRSVMAGQVQASSDIGSHERVREFTRSIPDLECTTLPSRHRDTPYGHWCRIFRFALDKQLSHSLMGRYRSCRDLDLEYGVYRGIKFSWGRQRCKIRSCAYIHTPSRFLNLSQLRLCRSSPSFIWVAIAVRSRQT